MIIHNYGLYWHADDVYWGKPTESGKLYGVPSMAKTGKHIDFRDQSGIYALYQDYKLVYVGQTGSGNQKLFTRLKTHRRQKLSGRWNRFSWFGTRRVLKNGELAIEKKSAPSTHGEALNHMEAILISVGEPELNQQGGAWGSSVTKYKQVRDTRLAPEMQKMIEELWNFHIKQQG